MPSASPPPDRPALKRGSGAQMVYEILRDEILDLTLPPGSLIDEVQLSERIGVSRTPIREALVRLAGEGLINTLPNRSTIVAPIDFLNIQSFFDAITLMYRVTTRGAAEHHKPQDLIAIRAHQADFTKAVLDNDVKALIFSNREFHAAIATAGHNPYFTAIFLRLLDDERRLLQLHHQSFCDKIPHEFIEEHDQMIAAIVARDVSLCDTFATSHADHIVMQITKLIAEDRRSFIPL